MTAGAGPRPDGSPEPGPEAPEDLLCSAKGCRADATWGLRWNNPKLHTATRRKVWLACDVHRAHLEQFLSARGFHRDTVAVGDLGPGDG
ncbi:hypothetical protein ICW40_06640 [Actinotalea ferrariae]|uniref:hypothetical protein n=1 Tax=Actinotalea ferrariae TaxID=1386098 RepID=UPI001C8CD4D0|nr:hypothetical protein [Actinotalea ferrariae]MBX9244483.1 hypothetical protein [Actinotalea ferrariae]